MGLSAKAAIFLLVLASPSLQAEPGILPPRIDVIGTPENLENIAGSGDIVTGETLEKSRVFTTNEALRKVPGVHVRDEEGFGLRPNIGIRA